MADVDPSLSLTAQGLWSDEESLHGQPTDEEDADPSSTTAQQPRRVPRPQFLRADFQGRRKKHEKSPAPEIKNLLGQATSLYTAGDLQGSKAVIHEIIKQDNECILAYSLLSQIYDEMDMKTEAVNALFSAAVNSVRDGALWIRVANMSQDLGFWTQALKCFDR